MENRLETLAEPANGEKDKPNAKDSFLAKELSELQKLVFRTEQRIEQIVAEANNAVGQLQQQVAAAKAKIAEIEGLIG